VIPLCLDEKVGAIIWSPLARGRLARPWEAPKSTARAETDSGYADLLHPRSPPTATTRSSTPSVRFQPDAAPPGPRSPRPACTASVVTAPLVGANTTTQIDDAGASLDIELSPDELAALEQPYMPRYDFQGISDEAELQRIRDRSRATPTCRHESLRRASHQIGLVSDQIRYSIGYTARLWMPHSYLSSFGSVRV
jgi:hypothetical protein